MCSLNDCKDLGCIVCLPFYCIIQIQWNSCMKILYKDMFVLRQKYEDLSKLEDELRWELRRNDGRRPIVNNNFGIWVEDVARLKLQIDNLRRPGRDNSFLDTRYCCLGQPRNFVPRLLGEANLLILSASSLISYGGAVRESQIFVGKEPKISQQIWKFLMDPMIGSIGIYGPGGVGKTTFITNIVNQLATTDTFDKIVSVTISKNVDWVRVVESIAMQLDVDLAENERKYRLSGNGRKSKYDVLCEHYQNMEKCLFIFDDMWDPAPEWVRRVIHAPTREKGFKIVIISRFRDVCQKMGVDKVINLARLSDTEAWELFVTKTGDHVLDPEIRGIAKQILKECAGLPITVVTVGHAMRDCPDAIAWRQILKYLQKEIQETGINDSIFSLLRFCYFRLKSKQIRRCFLYCGLFPENYKFKSEELVEYWMAEEYTQNSGDIVASMNEGKEILRQLIDANMLGMFMEGGNEFLKMHGIIRDFSISMLNKETHHQTMAEPCLCDFHDALCFQTNHLRRKKVSLIGYNPQYLYTNRIRSSVSTLLLKDNPLDNIPPSFFSSMPNLQVLDISHSAIPVLPSSLCEIPKLRALFLQYCTYLNHIPSLDKLQELQYLNLSGTLIKELPHGIERLAKLRSLDLSDTVLLERINPGVISALTNLEELLMQGSHICKINSPAAVECLKEIRFLTRLSILTLSAIGFQDHLDTILYLQGYNLKIFTVNVYGSAKDCV